jgi:hypothetical protein
MFENTGKVFNSLYHQIVYVNKKYAMVFPEILRNRGKRPMFHTHINMCGVNVASE